MSIPVTEIKQNCFFVGGNSPSGKSGNTNAGAVKAAGCTLDWWNGKITDRMDNYSETKVQAKAHAMGCLMEVDGSPLLDTVTFSSQTSPDNPGLLRVFIAAQPTNFDKIEAGMNAYLQGSSYTEDIFEILDVGGSTGYYWIDINISYNETGGNTDIIIGGAFESYNMQLPNILDASLRTQYVFINKAIPLTGTATWDISTWGAGSINQGTKLILEAFNKTPGDMNTAKDEYYQNPKEIFDSPTWEYDDDCWLSFDITGHDYSFGWVIDLTGSENFEMRNFRFHGEPLRRTVVAASMIADEGIVFRHCAFVPSQTSPYFEPLSLSNSVMVVDCFIGLGERNLSLTGNTALSNLIQTYVDCRVASINIFYLDGSTLLVSGCIIRGKSKLADVNSGKIDMKNCTVIAEDTTCVVFSSECQFYGLNNIMIFPHTAVLFDSSFMYNDVVVENHCHYDIENDRVPSVNVGRNADSSEAAIVIDLVTENPNFDTGLNLLEPLNPSVRNGGKPNANGNATAIGAIGVSGTGGFFVQCG